jgi:enoyl-CoA hydratase/carnithine racemase
MSDLLKLEKNGAIAQITMNNPPANTWTRDSLIALKGLVNELNNDKENIALLITGEGEKFFSAGADLKSFNASPIAPQEMAHAFGEAFETLSWYKGISIAAINGYAMGGGLEVALACDTRIAEEQATLALPEAKIGLLPCAGGTQNLSWLVGEAWAKRMILCGEQIKAEQALKIGLVEQVVEKGKALETAMELAKGSLRQSPDSIKACKQLIQASRKGNMTDALPLEREEFLKLFNGVNALEGVASFIEKRDPVWK